MQVPAASKLVLDPAANEHIVGVGLAGIWAFRWLLSRAVKQFQTEIHLWDNTERSETRNTNRRTLCRRDGIRRERRGNGRSLFLLPRRRLLLFLEGHGRAADERNSGNDTHQFQTYHLATPEVLTVH